MKLLVLTICSLISTIYCGVIVQLDTVGDGDVDANLSSDNEPHVSETFESKIGVIRPKVSMQLYSFNYVVKCLLIYTLITVRADW